MVTFPLKPASVSVGWVDAFVMAIARAVSLLPAATLCGLLSGYSHLLLDLPTERGIYVRGRRTSRRRLARSGDPALNALFALLGLALLLAGGA